MCFRKKMSAFSRHFNYIPSLKECPDYRREVEDSLYRKEEIRSLKECPDYRREVEDSLYRKEEIRSLKVDYAELLQSGLELANYLLLPDIRNLQDARLDENFLRAHFIKGNGESLQENVWVKIEQDRVYLLECPHYNPSYKRGLYFVDILKTEFLTTDRFTQLRVIYLSGSIIPAKMGNVFHKSGNSKKETPIFEPQRRKLERQKSLDFGLLDPDCHNHASREHLISQHFDSVLSEEGRSELGSVYTQLTHCSSLDGHPVKYCSSLEPGYLGKSKQKPSPSIFIKSNSLSIDLDDDTLLLTPPRQTSEDSGIEADAEELYSLIPKISSYSESESFILVQAHCEQFINHLRRTIVPLRNSIRKLRRKENVDKDELNLIGVKVHRFCQDSLISFPKTPNRDCKSPRYHETLKISIENVVLQFLHDLLWPLVKEMHQPQDKEVFSKQMFMYRHKVSLRELRVRDELNIPLPAALVELSSMEQCSTPLDRMTNIHDTVSMTNAHVREALCSIDTQHGRHVRYPNHAEIKRLVAMVLVRARLKYAVSTIYYIENFTFSAASYLSESFQIFKESVETVRRFRPIRFTPLTTNIKLEDLIRIAEKLDRRNSLEDRERFNPVEDWVMKEFLTRLEKCSEKLTKDQEAECTRLGNKEEKEERSKRLLSSLKFNVLCNKARVEDSLRNWSY